MPINLDGLGQELGQHNVGVLTRLLMPHLNRQFQAKIDKLFASLLAGQQGFSETIRTHQAGQIVDPDLLLVCEYIFYPEEIEGLVENPGHSFNMLDLRNYMLGLVERHYNLDFPENVFTGQGAPDIYRENNGDVVLFDQEPEPVPDPAPLRPVDPRVMQDIRQAQYIQHLWDMQNQGRQQPLPPVVVEEEEAQTEVDHPLLVAQEQLGNLTDAQMRVVLEGMGMMGLTDAEVLGAYANLFG